jgi:hypothetical protein
MLTDTLYFEEIFRTGDTIGVFIYGISVSIMVIIGIFRQFREKKSKK